MSGTSQETQVQPNDQAGNPAGEPPDTSASDPPPEGTLPAADVSAAPPSDEPKQITIPTSAVAKLKQEAAAKATEDFNRRLKALGYDSLEAFETAEAQRKAGGSQQPRAKRKRGGKKRRIAAEAHRTNGAAPKEGPPNMSTQQRQATPQPGQTPAQPESPRTISRLTAENQRLLDERRRLNRTRAQEEKRRKAVERERDGLRAEYDLRLAAVTAGVKDVDYAVHLLRQRLKGKTKEELEKFDEAAFFSTELRKSHPYLYDAKDVPADTGANPAELAGKGGDGAPPPPKAGAGAGEAPPNQQAKPKSAQDMSDKEYKELLKKHGLSNPAAGMPA